MDDEGEMRLRLEDGLYFVALMGNGTDGWRDLRLLK
jgi:hypothetical protein